MRGVLEIFKAKESLLTSQEVSSSDPYQQLEQTGTQYTYRFKYKEASLIVQQIFCKTLMHKRFTK